MVDDKTEKLQLIGFRLELHRFYINRNWQYFGVILLIDSLILNAYEDLQANIHLLLCTTAVSVGFAAIFYHLINWTNMKMDWNVKRLEALAPDLLESSVGGVYSLILWMKVGVMLAAVPYLFLAARKGGRCWFAVEVVSFASFVVLSEVIVHLLKRRAAVNLVGDAEGAKAV